MSTLIRRERIVDAKFPEILGQERAKEELRSALLMQRHVILLGPPGVGKTTIARSAANLLETVDVPIDIFGGEGKTARLTGAERFIRVQGSPDLTAEDLIGDIDPVKAIEFGPTSPQAFTPGKIFRAREGILFFDEVNRASEKLQNALLQVLQEGVVTLSGYDVPCPARFLFIGTMNPEDKSTEQLSDVFLDRFDVVKMDYPASQTEETTIVTKYGQKLCEFPENLVAHTVRFVRALREHKQIERKPSVRATIGLYERAQANAVLRGRKVVTLQDIMDAVPSVLAHRMSLKPSIKFLTTPEAFVEEEFHKFSENLARSGSG
jgi:MoxR-like ATPase